MRIALDARSVVSQRTGIGEYTRELARGLAREGRRHSFLLLTAEGAPTVLESESSGDIREERLRGSSQRGFRRLAWENLSLPRLLRQRGVDLFHNPVPLLPLRGLKCATVVTVPDTTPFDFPDWYRVSVGRSYRFRVRRSIEAADVIVALSDAVRDDVVRLFGVDPARVVTTYLAPGGRFGPAHDVAAAARLRERFPSPFILCVGDVMPRKNHARLIAAFEQIAARFPRVDLVIAGRRAAPDAVRTAMAGSQNLSQRIKFVEYVSDADLPELYRQAELLAFPSLSEGFGLPVVEAMASGLPVLTSRRSALPEVAGDAALLVDPENVDEIASGLRRLLGDERLQRELRERGLARARAFDWRTTVQRTLEAYERALENHRARR